MPASAPERIRAPSQSTRAFRPAARAASAGGRRTRPGSAIRLIQNSHCRSRLSTITPRQRQADAAADAEDRPDHRQPAGDLLARERVAHDPEREREDAARDALQHAPGDHHLDRACQRVDHRADAGTHQHRGRACGPCRIGRRACRRSASRSRRDTEAGQDPRDRRRTSRRTPRPATAARGRPASARARTRRTRSERQQNRFRRCASATRGAYVASAAGAPSRAQRGGLLSASTSMSSANATTVSHEDGESRGSSTSCRRRSPTIVPDQGAHPRSRPASCAVIASPAASRAARWLAQRGEPG